MSETAFAGPERRRHKLYVTRNTEYHVRDGVVVAVRARGDERWQEGHSALGMRVEGKVEAGTLFAQRGEPHIGERLYLARGDRDLVTSRIVAIERPPREAVLSYPTLAA